MAALATGAGLFLLPPHVATAGPGSPTPVASSPRHLSLASPPDSCLSRGSPEERGQGKNFLCVAVQARTFTETLPGTLVRTAV